MFKLMPMWPPMMESLKSRYEVLDTEDSLKIQDSMDRLFFTQSDFTLIMAYLLLYHVSRSSSLESGGLGSTRFDKLAVVGVQRLFNRQCPVSTLTDPAESVESHTREKRWLIPMERIIIDSSGHTQTALLGLLFKGFILPLLESDEEGTDVHSRHECVPERGDSGNPPDLSPDTVLSQLHNDFNRLVFTEEWKKRVDALLKSRIPDLSGGENPRVHRHTILHMWKHLVLANGEALRFVNGKNHRNLHTAQ